MLISPDVPVVQAPNPPCYSFFFFNNMYLFVFGYAGSSLLCRLFSLALGSGSYSLIGVCRLLIAVASLVVEQRL